MYALTLLVCIKNVEVGVAQSKIVSNRNLVLDPFRVGLPVVGCKNLDQISLKRGRGTLTN